MSDSVEWYRKQWRLPPWWGLEEEEHRNDLFDRWIADNERIVDRPRDTIRLLGIPETNVLQDHAMELQRDAYRLHAIPYFAREEELARSVDDWQKPAFVNPERLTAYTFLLTRLASNIPDEPVFILRDLCGVFGAVPSTCGEVFSRGLAFFDRYGGDNTWILSADGQNALNMGIHWPIYHVVASLAVFGHHWTTPLADEKGGFYGRAPEDPDAALAIARAACIAPYQMEFFSAYATFHDAGLEWTSEWRAALARGCRPVSRILSPGPEGGTIQIVTFSCPEIDQ